MTNYHKVLIYCFLIGVSFLMVLLYACKKDDNSDVQKASVTTVKVSSISSTNAVCEGKITSAGGSEWVNPGACWSDIITEPTHSDKKNTASGGAGTGDFSVLMEHLTPGTTYYVRAFASNLSGFGYGDVLSFSTTGSVVGEIVFNTELTYGSVNDNDGNSYKTINLGTQTWMAENLKTTKFADGENISQVTELPDWINLSTPAYCYFLNDKSKYNNTYGAIYNWHAINSGKLCPTGWHVPSSNDWTILTSGLGGAGEAAGKLMETGTSHWITANFINTNTSGFTALPGGLRQGTLDTLQAAYFDDLGYAGYFWTSTVIDEPGEDYNKAIGIRITGGFDQWVFPKTQGMAVRCVKD